MTEADYGLWSRPVLHSLSPMGNWVNYSLYYASGTDTLFLKGPGKTIGFAGGNKGRFIGKNYWSCLTKDGLHIVNLSDGKIRDIKGATFYQSANNYLAYLSLSGGFQQLSVETLDGNTLFTRENCTAFELSNAGSLVFNISKEGQNTICLYTSKQKLETLDVIKGGKIDAFIWSKDEDALAFLVKDSYGNNLYQFDFKLKRLNKLDNVTLGKQRGISPYNMPFFSDNGEIFFEVQEVLAKEKVDTVMIYNTMDKWVYPMEKDSDGFRRLPKLAMWDPKELQLLMVTDTLFPYCFLLNRQQKALVYNPKQYAPHNLKNEQRDLYLLDLKSGKKELLLAKQDDEYGPFSLSPSGSKLAFFRDGKWRIKEKDSLPECLDCQIAHPTASPSSMSGELTPEGFAGWSRDEKYAIVYDQFDVWKIDVATKKAIRLTRGREKKIVFRIRFMQADSKKNNYQLRSQRVINLDETLIMKASTEDFTYNGFFKWNKKSGLTPIVWKNLRIDQFINTGRETFSWIEESFQQPFEIHSKISNKETVLLAKTNPQHDRFEWGKETKIDYFALGGQHLTGTLYYPAGFEEGKTYPLIVSVYQKQSPFYHQYIAPSVYYGDGFNVTHYLNEDYFVLLPDIIYRVGNPGISATECILASVDVALATAPIDASKIGLIGHSYGGYETSFAITQTDRFAVAVAGAAPTDFVSNYLSLGGPQGIPEAWRYEHFQGRMKNNLFEDISGYIRNSPVFQAAHVNTPLLSWTGEIDDNVTPEQSIEFHLALRRLGKSNVMLIYKDEGHALLKRENCFDLTHRIQEWFDYYLKGGPIPKWSVSK